MENTKFNILLEDGTLIKDCNVFSNFGSARDIRDIEKALHKENRVIVNNEFIMSKVIAAKNVYEVEML